MIRHGLNNCSNNSETLRSWLLLAPSLLTLLLLFGGGVILAALQSLGWLPFLGQSTLSLDAYAQFFQGGEFVPSLVLTLWIALASTALSTALAVLCALALRRSFRSQRWATFIFQLNLPIPHSVAAVMMLFLLSQSGFLARIAYAVQLVHAPSDFPALVFDPLAIGIIVEYVWKTTVFTGVNALGALQSIGEDYEEVARSLGAGRWQRFRFILLPLLKPALLSASVLVFAFTFGTYETPFLLGQHYPSALPVLAYRSYVDVDLTARPAAMAMSVVIIVLSAGLILVYTRLARGGAPVPATGR
jgi:putative spermidine/putrescine transport system permease protein